MKLEKGFISDSFSYLSDESTKRFYPCFFIGVELANNPNELKANVGSVGNLKSGQFILTHEFNGHACSTVDLFGIFLPITTCRDPIIVDALRTITIDFAGEDKCYIQSWRLETPPGTSLPGIEELRAEFSKFSPLQLRPVARKVGTEEAIVRFTDPATTFDWLKLLGFQYIEEFNWVVQETRGPYKDSTGKGAYTFRRISAESTKLRAMFWRNFSEFESWLNAKHLPTPISEVQAAFLYENSD
ncbi:MAG: hypothetical protein HY059_18460 [Proteobacteria bacterium]|nr:hypothetical protein [Pseudomonadota bacterium]